MSESMPPPAERPADAREARLAAVAEVRRGRVLDAARQAFFELGFEGASLREIARRAGYTPGALYSYFANKEELYGALLDESLDRLNGRVAAVLDDVFPGMDRSAAIAVLRAKSAAFHDFYRENPRDLDLGFYLFNGVQPRGLTPEFNERLNAKLFASLAPCEAALAALGLPADAARAEMTALFAHITGLLILAHTGRIRMFRQDPQALFGKYLDELVARAGGA